MPYLNTAPPADSATRKTQSQSEVLLPAVVMHDNHDRF